MTLIGLLLTLLVIGVILYLIEHFLPLDPVILLLIRVLVVVLAIFFLLQFLMEARWIHLPLM